MTVTFGQIGADEARWLIARIMVMVEPDRKTLIDECAALCPPGKNKRHDQQDDPSILRWAA